MLKSVDTTGTVEHEEEEDQRTLCLFLFPAFLIKFSPGFDAA